MSEMIHTRDTAVRPTQLIGTKVTFSDWTGDRQLKSLGTNAGSATIPFQRWQNVKEAFTPELVARAIRESDLPVNRCIDPFGGSGTTGLACQFLGIHPIIAELNPFLADLIEAKLVAYPSIDRLMRDLDSIVEAASNDSKIDVDARAGQLPPSFVEPGKKDRWVFDRSVAKHIFALKDAIDALDDESHRRLFRVLLGGILVPVSNVFISGKGRRYRRGWSSRGVSPTWVCEQFLESARQAIRDISSYGNRKCTTYEVIQGDSRSALRQVDSCELAVFSPPYPNSFDYTDVYNLELWMLGYLDSREANASLRSATLSSHLQVSRYFPAPPGGSPSLRKAIAELCVHRDTLWDRRIPDMVGAYFSDLVKILFQLSRTVVVGGSVWIVIGDSRYAGVQIPSARVLAEVAESLGWTSIKLEAIRAMRTAAQQGGERELTESLLVLRNDSR